MKFFVDRFEGDYAVLLCEGSDEAIDFPKSLLPLGTREGSALRFDISLDDEARRRASREIGDLYASLGDDP